MSQIHDDHNKCYDAGTARLLPLALQKRAIRFGVLKGKITISDDFDAPLPDEVLDSFEGK